jgi:hypothetical protein
MFSQCADLFVQLANIDVATIVRKQPTYLRGAGRSVDITFHSGEQLQAARLKVRALSNSFSAASEKQRVCFLDVKKTREELRLARLEHRAFDFRHRHGVAQVRRCRSRVAQRSGPRSVACGVGSQRRVPTTMRRTSTSDWTGLVTSECYDLRELQCG